MNPLRWIGGLFRFRQTNWKALLLCLLAAVVFWFFSALNEEHVADIHLPVEWEVDVSRFVATGPLPARVEVNVTGKGWDVLAKELGWRTAAAVITLENPDRRSHILTRDIMKELTASAEGLRINFIHGDTLPLHFEKILTRKVRVVPDEASLDFREGFGMTGPIVCEPDEVAVSGPASVVRALSSKHAVAVAERSIDQPFHRMVALKFTDPLLQADPAEIMVTIPVGKVRRSVFRVPIEIDAPGRGWRTMQDSSTVEVEMPESALEAVRADRLRVRLTVRKPGADRFRMRGVVLGLPDEARVIRADTIEVYRDKE